MARVEAVSSGIRSTVEFDRRSTQSSIAGPPASVSAGRITVNDAFFTLVGKKVQARPIPRNLPLATQRLMERAEAIRQQQALQTTPGFRANILAFESGKAAWLAMTGTPTAASQQLMAFVNDPGATYSALEFAPSMGDDLGCLGDDDSPSRFGYAFRMAALNIPTPNTARPLANRRSACPSASRTEWQAMKQWSASCTRHVSSAPGQRTANTSVRQEFERALAQALSR